MADILSLPRKRRTRAHVIADISVNHVERFVYEAGFTAERKRHDYGCDLTLFTHDAEGYLDAGFIPMQLKAAEKLKLLADGAYVFDLDARDIVTWLRDPMPVILVLYEAATRRAYWLYIQRFFQQNPTRIPRRGSAFIRVRVPKTNRLNRSTIAKLRQFKENVLGQRGGVNHG